MLLDYILQPSAFLWRMSLDISSNRLATKYSRKEMLRRMLWSIGEVLFTFSPRPCFAWRRALLRCFGASVGRHVHFYPSSRIYFPWNLTVGDWSAIGEDAFIYNLGSVTLGQSTTISHRAHLCAGTHDYTQPDLPLLKPPIVIRDSAWVCADAFIGPGVTVGEGAVVAARAVVVRDVAPWTIVAGNPASFIKQRICKLPRAEQRSTVDRRDTVPF
jgi:putative colanic acid biosynthesis acetyltransferase WcaF